MFRESCLWKRNFGSECYRSTMTISRRDTSEFKNPLPGSLYATVGQDFSAMYCQLFKVSQNKTAGKMFTRQIRELFDTVCADFVGPPSRSKSWNSMLLVFFDAFSKWVELVSLRKAILARHERAFRERSLCVWQRNTHTRSLANIPGWNKNQNPTEMANRTIKTIVSQLFEGQQTNGSISDSTGFSPAFIVQCREPRLPGSSQDHPMFLDHPSRKRNYFEMCGAENTQRAS